MSGIKVRAKRAAFPQTEVLAGAIVPFLSPLPTEPEAGSISTWLNLFALPW